MKKILLTIAIVLASLNCVAAPESAKKADAKPAVERVEKKQGQSTGRPWKGHEVFRGPKGGLYYWHVPKTGKNAGQQVKRYLTKEEREQFNAGSDGTKKQ